MTVTVGGQTLTTTAGTDGAWTVDAAALTETLAQRAGVRADVAGNTGTASQVLTVDVTLPVLTIDGGAVRTTSDTSPWTYGTTAEQAGTIVHVTLDDQSLTATVLRRHLGRERPDRSRPAPTRCSPRSPTRPRTPAP